MAKILCIETSQEYCSICVHQDGKVLLEEVSSKAFNHTSVLSVQVQSAFAQISKDSIDAVAVSIGPGSYTGLRVGVSSAKGLCYGLEIPMIAIPTLQLIAAPYRGRYDKIIPTMDARRDDIYTATFDTDLYRLEDDTCLTIDANTFGDYGSDKVMICGNGATKAQKMIMNPLFVYENTHPVAKNMAVLSYEAYLRQNFANVTNVIPVYLKTPNITTQKKNILNVRKT